MEDTLFLVLYWTGPIGVGIFLVCLGAMLYLLTRANEIDQRTKQSAKDSKEQK